MKSKSQKIFNKTVDFSLKASLYAVAALTFTGASAGALIGLAMTFPAWATALAIDEIQHGKYKWRQ